MMEHKVVMSYLGGILSKNASKYPSGRGFKPFVSMWMKELADKVSEVPKCEEYEVRLFGRFWDEASVPDLANLHEVIGDGLKRGLGVDDKYFRFVDEGYETGVFNPELVITLVGEEKEVSI